MDDNKSYDNKIQTIHTLEGDLASAVNDNNYGKNIIKIVTDPNKNTYSGVGDNNHNEINKADLFTKKNVIILLILIILISSASVIFYLLYKAKNIENNPDGIDIVSTSTASTSTDNTRPLIKNTNFLNPEVLNSADFSKLNRFEIISEIIKIKSLLTDKKIGPNNNIGINTNLGISQLFEKIRYSGNESLLRSFNDKYSFGLYSLADNKFENYLLIEVNNFDLAFKSILDWEKYMAVDLKDIFIGNNISTYNTSTSTASSTTSSTTTENKYLKKDTGVFVDRILKNYDIREYVENKSDIHLIYGFINNKFLLITSGESSFIDIKDRLLKENIVR